jgi:hypothetical protein
LGWHKYGDGFVLTVPQTSFIIGRYRLSPDTRLSRQINGGKMKKTILGGLILALFALAASAQDSREQAQARLIRALIQKNVVVKLDMPATVKGVEVLADKQNSTDAGKNLKRLKAYGTGLRSGDIAMVTSIRVMKDEIHLELDGGGLPEISLAGRGAVQTRASTSETGAMARINRAGDSSRSDLEEEHSRVKYESSVRKRNDALATAVNETQRQEALERARAAGPKMGSRFVIKFDRSDPAAVTADELKRILADYVAF